MPVGQPVLVTNYDHLRYNANVSLDKTTMMITTEEGELDNKGL